MRSNPSHQLRSVHHTAHSQESSQQAGVPHHSLYRGCRSAAHVTAITDVLHSVGQDGEVGRGGARAHEDGGPPSEEVPVVSSEDYIHLKFCNG